MRLTEASVAIRPRSAWEALDLGVLMAQRHARLLMLSWALVTLPIFALLCALLWQYPGWAIFLFWWLKPAYERLPLYILSQALFGTTPTLKQALKAWPSLLKPQLLASLTWRRLSTTRSFDLPVLQLEGLSGQARSQRLIVLGQRSNGAATWLTVVGVHLETALWMGLGTLFYLMLPQQIELNWNWQSLVTPDSGEWLWLEHLSNAGYALLLIAWEPVYVACGFTLYLNRRTELEAWDIELVLRRLRQRLIGTAYALLLGCALLLGQPATTAWADEAAPATQLDPHGPDAPRLLKQPLSSQAAHDGISRLLDAPPFQHRESVTRWRLGEEQQQTEDEPEQAQPETDNSFADLLEKLFNFSNSLDTLAQLFEVLLWGSLLALLAFILWRCRDWLQTFGERLGLPKKRQRIAAPTQLFGLEVAPQSLPDDVASEAQRLWDSDPRAALGLLYRALLSRLLYEHQLALKASHTEGEVLGLVENLNHQDLQSYSEQLTRHWQALAYGHRQPSAEQAQALCQSWRELFDQGAQA
ncbi:conserved membrane hypothetical protein [Pseudomonas sp. 8Z]|uniref:DUF4129 domain-containing protein n=1 Tax=Pseudomonas sp. 8Z TaxID=2653166 RepID=UPI0012F339F3|nr:DUF4129 domain-containing protein [Pseudomonas sp. 8Z]VXC92567.1 conserved membrane hypothetical protein [Pseudomonas sp. 8Z]